MGLIIGGTTPRKNQDLSGLVVQETGKSLVADTEIAKIHALNADAETASSIATIINGVSSDTIADADTIPWYQAIGGALKKITWANIIATIRTAILGSTSGILKANGSGVVSAASVGTDYQAPLTFGIADTNAVKVDDADVYAGQYARFTAKGLEGVESSTVLFETIVIACSDETTDLTIGLAKVTFRMPFAMTLFAGKEGIRASVNTAPVGSTIEVDVNEGGSSILSTILSIDASEKTSYTAMNEVVISDTTLADDAEITIDIDQIGSSTAGKGLKVALIGYRS